MAELRAALAEDISAIMTITLGSLGGPGQVRALVQEHASLVAVEHGEIVGFLALKAAHFYGRDFIDLLFVAPRWRRHGLGRALMQAALQNASTSRVFVSTNASNTPMRELLRSERWIPSGVLTGLDEGDPEHVFFHDAPPGWDARSLEQLQRRVDVRQLWHPGQDRVHGSEGRDGHRRTTALALTCVALAERHQ
jgi:GNAT superfamily N-acetyltransferase